jgi:hypothetical protein
MKEKLAQGSKRSDPLGSDVAQLLLSTKKVFYIGFEK